GDVVADQARKVSGHMHHRLVLDVGVVADHDPVDVTAENGVKPDARMVANSDITDNHRAVGQINALPDRGLALQKRFQLSDDISHDDGRSAWKRRLSHKWTRRDG